MRLAIPLKLIVTVAILSAFGCSSDNKGKIEGTRWTSNAGSVKGAAIPAGIMTLSFSTDGKLNYVAGPQTMSGTYSLGSGNTVVFKFDKELSGRKTHYQKITINGNTLTLADSDGTQLTFTKVQ